MIDKIDLLDVIKFMGGRNCVLCSNLVGVRATLEYQNGKLIKCFTEKNKDILPIAERIYGICREIDCLQDLVVSGVITLDAKANKKDVKKYINTQLGKKKISDSANGYIFFIADEMVDVKGYYEWYDEIEEDNFKTHNNSSLYNKYGCLDKLGFTVISHESIIGDKQHTVPYLEGVIERMIKSSAILDYIPDYYTVKYNDTPYVKQLQKSNKKVELSFAV